MENEFSKFSKKDIKDIFETIAMITAIMGTCLIIATQAVSCNTQQTKLETIKICYQNIDLNNIKVCERLQKNLKEF